MDPLTHTVSGVVLANLVCPDEHRLSYTAALVVAANLPDVDFITRPMKTLGSPKYYHNLTHSLAGLLLLAAGAAAVAHALFPFLHGGVLFGLFLLGGCVHVLLDTVITSGAVRLFWPFSANPISLALLAGLNFRTSSRQCGKPAYVRCTLCQLRWSAWNPILFLLLGGTLAALLWPEQRRALSAAALGLCLAVLLLLALWRQGLKTRLLQRFPDLDGAALHLYPADVVPGRWIAVAQDADTYRIFRLGGLPFHVREAGRLPRAEALADPCVQQSMKHPLYQLYLPRMAHPYAKVDSRNGTTQVTWQDLRYFQDPDIDLYAVKLLYDSRMQVIREEFRERWNAGASLSGAR